MRHVWRQCEEYCFFGLSKDWGSNCTGSSTRRQAEGLSVVPGHPLCAERSVWAKTLHYSLQMVIADLAFKISVP